MKRWNPFGVALGLVLLGAAVHVQAQALPPLCKVAKGTVISLGSDAPKPLWLEEGGNSIQATCSAYCAGGSQIEVTCPGSCTAVDINCPYTPGYVTCSNGSTTYCQPNPCPTGVSYCESVNGSSCSPNGWTRSCTGSDLGTYTCRCFQNHWVCPL
jgi:hypothetical protein